MSWAEGASARSFYGGLCASQKTILSVLIGIVAIGLLALPYRLSGWVVGIPLGLF